MEPSPLYISHFSDSRANNFDFIRFLAATLVIFSHSYPLSTGNENLEPLMWLSKGQSTLGDVAVFVFFITSGYLITQSYDRKKDIISFAISRTLRIFPGLIVVLLLSVFLLGPIITSSINYFTETGTYTFLASVTLYQFNHFLPGVFEDNIFGRAVNGSLWTLKYEFLFYILVGVLGMLNKLNKKTVIFLFLCSFFISFFSLPFGETINRVPLMFQFFAAGMIIYLFRDKIPLNKCLAYVSIFIIIFSIFAGGFTKVFIIFGSYLLMYIVYSTKFKLHNFSKYGDFSYGLYIYAFPIQQTVTYFSGGEMNYLTNFIISFPIVLFFSYLSWHLIERPTLKLKKSKTQFYQPIKKTA